MAVRTIALLLILAPTVAQGETVRLTPEQAEAAIEYGAARKAKVADALPELPQRDRGVHGELGVAVGTGGYRSMYGVVGIPLGENRGIALGYGQERGRGYEFRGRDICRGVRAELCDWRLQSQLLDAQ